MRPEPSLSESPQLDDPTHEFTLATSVALVQKQFPPSVHKQLESQLFIHEDLIPAALVSVC